MKGRKQELLNYLQKKRWMVYIFLFTAAFFILCLRGGVFSWAGIYAEDGIYLSRIINTGFWKSCFATRWGGGNDFYNMGSYLLLWISLQINRVCYGYNLECLPYIIGIVSSVFWASIAMLGLYTYEKKSRFLALSVYAAILCVPVGGTAVEIFGRVLNMVFIFPVLAVLLLVNLWDARYQASVGTCLCEFFLFICGMSFPVSFGALGIWIMAGCGCAVKEKKMRSFIKANLLKLCILLAGLLILPMMIGSKGASAGMVIKKEALVEFIIARHMIYSFVYYWYRQLNDMLVVFIFAAAGSIILTALYVEYKEREWGYFVLSGMVMGCILASAFMRLPMSSFFGDYQSTFPDRYYYGCNILFCILVFHGLYVISRKYKSFLTAYKLVMGLSVFFWLINPHLIPQMSTESRMLIGEGDEGSDWKWCLEQAYAANSVNENGMYMVEIFPYGRGWRIGLPSVYVSASVE